VDDLRPGEIHVRGLSRSFRILHERNATLKETLLRRRRTVATELWALREVDLDIAPGESVGIVGRNGSGKSTLLKLVAGIMPPTSGTVRSGGTVASMLELGAGFHPDFTGRENVYMNAAIYGLSKAAVDDRLDGIVAFSELADFIDMPVRTYSSGMYMRLAFSIASHVDPDILLLDEVLAVGDEAFQQKCMGRIFDFKRRGGTILFVSHDPAGIERICDRAILVADGRIASDGEPADTLLEYHRLLAGEPADGGGTSLHRDPAKEWGTREAVIRQCRVLGPDGSSTRFLAGDPFTVEIVVESQPHVGALTYGVALLTPEGLMIFGTNNRINGVPLRLEGPLTRIEYRIPALPLHTGRFAITVAITSEDNSVVYHHLDRWLEFSVFQRAPGLGIVEMEVEWNLETVAAADVDAVASLDVLPG
jgi:ABC-type polysaccharide/polyol phosphate transport system ATPase subunit